MNLVYGEIIDLQEEEGMRIGSIRVAGAVKKAPLELVPGAECGDTILMCDGVAIAVVDKAGRVETPADRVEPIGFCHSTFII